MVKFDKPFDLLYHKVRVVMKDGKTYEGEVTSFEAGLESDHDYDQMTIESDDYIVGVYEDEVESLEILDPEEKFEFSDWRKAEE